MFLCFEQILFDPKKLFLLDYLCERCAIVEKKLHFLIQFWTTFFSHFFFYRLYFVIIYVI